MTGLRGGSGSETNKVAQSLIARNVTWLKSFIRVVVGIVWLVDGSLKFAPGFVDSFPSLIKAEGQPAWLQPWFSFWSNVATSNAALIVYTTGALELALGAALVLGFMRKIAYLGGVVLSLFIWAIPEGFGGPYGPGSTDIGTGVVYSLLFFALIMISTLSGPSKYSLDFLIERKYPYWKRIAEFR